MAVVVGGKGREGMGVTYRRKESTLLGYESLLFCEVKREVGGEGGDNAIVSLFFVRFSVSVSFVRPSS